MLTGTFLDDVATNEIFALDTAGPPALPFLPPLTLLPSSCPVIDYTRLFTQSIHGRIGRLFILDGALDIDCVYQRVNPMTPRRTRARARATRLARLSNSLADGGVHRRQLPSAYIIPASPSRIIPRETLGWTLPRS